MGEGDQPSVTPEDRVRQLEQQAKTDEEALQKMLLAYKGAEADLEKMKTEIEVLNQDIVDKEQSKEALDNLLRNLRREKDEMEVKLAQADTKIPYLENELDKTKEILTREEARTGRIMEVAEETAEAEEWVEAEIQVAEQRVHLF